MPTLKEQIEATASVGELKALYASKIKPVFVAQGNLADKDDQITVLTDEVAAMRKVLNGFAGIETLRSDLFEKWGELNIDSLDS